VTLEQRLAEVVGADHVLVDPGLVPSYETDWTGRYHRRARCVARPADTAQTAAVVQTCQAAGVAISVQGGNTGLVGASVPADGAVVLSTRRLRELGPVDAISAQVTVGAGVTLAELQGHVRPHGLDVGVDFAARESCTVGGMVATNAGGERVLRYGTTRAQLLGAEAVLPDGSLVSRLAGLPKAIAGVAPAARPILFGHVNEGNLHVNVLDALDAAEQVEAAVLRLVASYGGSISAEHGVGRAKRAYLELSRSPEEIAVMRAIKRALDPQGLLNPGVLLD
jgi:FAD/FMN-containing dehydrogenase